MSHTLALVINARTLKFCPPHASHFFFVDGNFKLNDSYSSWGFIRCPYLGDVLYADSDASRRTSPLQKWIEGLLMVLYYCLPCHFYPAVIFLDCAATPVEALLSFVND